MHQKNLKLQWLDPSAFDLRREKLTFTVLEENQNSNLFETVSLTKALSFYPSNQNAKCRLNSKAGVAVSEIEQELDQDVMVCTRVSLIGKTWQIVIKFVE